MWEQIIGSPDLIFYILAAEGLLLCVLQFRTNGLLKKEMKVRKLKTEKIKTWKEEVKNGESGIPVVKFEKMQKKEKEGTASFNSEGAPADAGKTPSKELQRKTLKIAEKGKPCNRQECFDAREIKILQDMLTEYFG